jgi:polyisoprenyl-phosphate glycosyltransferase
MLKLTVITPVYNEAQVIDHFHKRTRAVLDSLNYVDATILYVLDRCSDNTLDILRGIALQDAKTRVLVLSSRFGHQMSLLAGIEHSLDADALIMMDSDLQHPPELIPELLSKFKIGNDVVYTIRRDTEDVGIIRLVSKRVAKILSVDFQERNMFLRGIFSWIGFQQIGVEYKAEKRFAGESKYSLSRMVRLASAGILSFSTKPLQLGIVVGICFAALAFLFVLWAVIEYFTAQRLDNPCCVAAAFQRYTIDCAGHYGCLYWRHIRGSQRAATVYC